MCEKLIQIKMEKLKSTIYVILMLLMITACTSENDSLKIESQQIDYEKLNLGLKENIISFSKMIEYDESLSKDIDKFLEIGDETIFLRKQSTLEKSSTEEKITYNKEDLSEVYSENQKEFLVSFYNELANSEDGFILDIVINYKNSLNDQNFSSEEYNQIYTQLITSEQSILVLDGITKEDMNYERKSSFSSKSYGDGFWACMRKKAGRAIGEGLAQGAIVGAISGAYYGVTGSSVVLPGIGTATGAVGGAVFGAASGAVVGAVGGALWTARGCGGGSAFKKWLIENAQRT
jgi:hypothetical protein